MNFLLAMFPALANHGTEIKLTLAAGLGLGAWLAQSVTEVKGLTELGLNGLCIVAVIVIGKLFLDERAAAKAERAAHAAEIKEIWAAHNEDAKTRETKVLGALADNTKGLGELTGLTKEQTDFFRSFIRQAVENTIKKPTIP